MSCWSLGSLRSPRNLHIDVFVPVCNVVIIIIIVHIINDCFRRYLFKNEEFLVRYLFPLFATILDPFIRTTVYGLMSNVDENLLNLFCLHITLSPTFILLSCTLLFYIGIMFRLFFRLFIINLGFIVSVTWVFIHW